MAAVATGYGTVVDHVEEYRQWALGDVWAVIPDGKWGMSGIYADDPQCALAYYRETYEDAPAELGAIVGPPTPAEPTSPTGFARHDPPEASALSRAIAEFLANSEDSRTVRSAEWLYEHQDDDSTDGHPPAASDAPRARRVRQLSCRARPTTP